MRKFTLTVLVLLVSVFFLGQSALGQAFTKTVNHVQYTQTAKVTPPSSTFEIADMYTCDFEAEVAWTFEFTPWTVLDVDMFTTYSMTGYTWPHAGEAQAFIVFDPATTDPPLTEPEIQAHTGAQFGACLASVPSGGDGNDDWFISDMVSLAADSDGASFTFWAKSYTHDYGAERFNVAVSTTTPDPAEFTVISTAPYVEAPLDWTEYVYDLSAYAGMDVYVAIQCVSNDAFIFMIDDLVINPGGGGGEMCDDFDSYTAGDFLCTQSTMWTTWDDNPGGDYDGYVSDMYASSSPNSLGIDLAVIESDIVTDLGQKTTGMWEISLDIYVPDGGTWGGYYNVMQDMTLFGAANEWGFQCFFKSDGTGYFQQADFTQVDFTYNLAEWNSSTVVVDLDDSTAYYYINGNEVAVWQWNNDGPNMLGAVDIYATADGNDDPYYFIDNFCFKEFVPAPPCDDFDSYTAGDFLCTQSDRWTTWDDNPGGDYDGYVSDAMAATAPNSLNIDLAVIESDIVTDLGQKTTGSWEISLDIYVPDGGTYGGYYNVMQDMTLFGAANEWGFQCFFKSDGTGYFQQADFTQVDFTYNLAAWNHSSLIVDLDNAQAYYYINGVEVAQWLWNNDGPNMLGAVDIYATADGNDDPMYYIDNFCFVEAEPMMNCDNFDSYTAGDFLCTQSTLWTTWDDNPGGDYDGYISDAFALSAPNSLEIDLAVIESDLIYNLDQKTSGSWAISLDIYVPDGGTYGGYYNVMQDMTLYGASNEWGFQCFFKSDGTGYFQQADFTQVDFAYNVAEWNHSVLYVNLDDSVAQYEINGSIVSTWQWNNDGPNMLGVIDIYATADGNDDPMYYIDNVCFDEHIGVGIGDEPSAVEQDITTNIYPNPARDRITVEANSIIDEVMIYNNMGQLVFSGQFDNDQITVNTSNFITGMYIVQIVSGDAVEVRKLIIE